MDYDYFLLSKRRNLRQTLKNKIETHQNKRDPNPKLLQILMGCAHVNDVAESIEFLQDGVKYEALKCRTKINRFLQLHEQLLNATTFNQILGFNLPFYDTVTRKIANIDYTLSTFELNIEQASEIKNCEWEEAETLLEPGCLDKIETLTVKDPDGIEKKMKLAISKVDGLFDIFKTLTDYWDPMEDDVNDTLDAILAQTQFALREIQFM